MDKAMTVHFIGAGPGAADLITVRGRDLIARCPVCLYAGSLVPRELLEFCPPGARVINTASMSLDEIETEFAIAHAEGRDVARLHSGDLSIYSALAEQLRRLKRRGIAYTLTPGVPAFAAAAAALECELTIPEVAQSVVLTRVSGRASRMPEHEKLATFAKSGATLVIHLAIHAIDAVAAELTPFYGQVVRLFSAIFLFITLIMGVIVLFAVVNTMTMNVMECTNEIGTIRAMGVRRNGIRAQFVVEGWMLGAIAATVGVVLAFGVAAAINHAGLNWTPPGNANPVPFRLAMPADRPPLLIGTWLGLVLVATLAALLPANRAARLPVVDALRHV